MFSRNEKKNFTPVEVDQQELFAECQTCWLSTCHSWTQGRLPEIRRPEISYMMRAWMERSLHTVLRASSRSTKKWSWPSALWGEIPIQEFTEIHSDGIWKVTSLLSMAMVRSEFNSCERCWHCATATSTPASTGSMSSWATSNPYVASCLKTDAFCHAIRRYFLTP